VRTSRLKVGAEPVAESSYKSNIPHTVDSIQCVTECRKSSQILIGSTEIIQVQSLVYVLRLSRYGVAL